MTRGVVIGFGQSPAYTLELGPGTFNEMGYPAAISSTGTGGQYSLSAAAGGFLSIGQSATLSTTAAPGFPISGIWNAEITNTATSYLEGLAPYNFITFISWMIGQPSGTTPAAVMQSVKSYAAAAGNPLCKTLQYNIWNEWWPSISDSGAFNNALINALNSNNYWWLNSNYPTLPSSFVNSQDGAPKIAVNVTNTTPSYNISSVGSVTGPGTVNCAQMLAWLFYQQYIAGNSNALNSSDPVVAANPYLDGTDSDNQENSPYVPISSPGACWLTTSTQYICSSSTQNTAVMPAVGAGYAQYAGKLRSLYPTTPSGSRFLIGGNCGGFAFGTSVNWPSGMSALYDLPLMENPFGIFENFNGSNFNNLIASFQLFEVLLNVQPGNYVRGLIEEPSYTTNWTSGNQASWQPSDWQAFRYQAGVFGLMRGPPSSTFPQAPAGYGSSTN